MKSSTLYCSLICPMTPAEPRKLILAKQRQHIQRNNTTIKNIIAKQHDRNDHQKKRTTHTHTKHFFLSCLAFLLLLRLLSFFFSFVVSCFSCFCFRFVVVVFALFLVKPYIHCAGGHKILCQYGAHPHVHPFPSISARTTGAPNP